LAAKGGGAWKVAYADFVTAMMAFFMVMWLVSQKPGVKEAVAKYFSDPVGSSKRPGRIGAIFGTPQIGSLPKAEEAALGKGRTSYTAPGEQTPATKMVGDWLHGDDRAMAHWKKQAERAREAARISRDVLDKLATVEEAAAQILSRQMKDELGRPAGVQGIQREILAAGLADVNWNELAEDILAR
jgi:flagellar motor protein MotB